MVARTGKPADPGPETVKNGCIYWYGFCQMCPFTSCLHDMNRRQRRASITAYVIKVLNKNSLTTGVIRVAMKVSKQTVYNALKEG